MHGHVNVKTIQFLILIEKIIKVKTLHTFLALFNPVRSLIAIPLIPIQRISQCFTVTHVSVHKIFKPNFSIQNHLYVSLHMSSKLNNIKEEIRFFGLHLSDGDKFSNQV